MCATNVSGHLQRVVGGTSIAWVFLTSLEALWEVSQTRALRRQRQMNLVAIREGRTMPVGTSQAAAAAAVLAAAAAASAPVDLRLRFASATACVSSLAPSTTDTLGSCRPSCWTSALLGSSHAAFR